MTLLMVLLPTAGDLWSIPIEEKGFFTIALICGRS